MAVANDGAPVHGIHGRAGGAVEGAGERGQLTQGAHHPGSHWRIYEIDIIIILFLERLRFGLLVGTPSLAVGDEEALVGREKRLCLFLLFFSSFANRPLVRVVGEADPQHVRMILRELFKVRFNADCRLVCPAKRPTSATRTDCQ